MRRRRRWPNGRRSSSCCESSREACWQEMRIIGCLASFSLSMSEAAFFQTAPEHHARPIQLYPDIGRCQLEILTQFFRIDAEYLAQHEHLADAFRQLVDA